MEATTEALPEGEIAEISIFCHNLRDMDWFSKSDPFTVLFAYPSPRTPEAVDQLLDFQLACKTSTSSDPDRKSTVQVGDPAEWCCVGETEVVWNELSPAFVKKFYLPHGAQVHRAARLRFEVYDMDSDTGPLEKQDFLGATECTLPQLTQAHPRVRTMTLCDKKMKERPRYGKFTATAEVFRVMHPLHYLDISVVFCIGNEMPHQEQIFYVLSRRVHDTIEGNEPLWVRIHRSGALTPPPGHGTQEFGFQEMTISETQLTANDRERQLRIELFIHRNNGSHVRVGCTKPFSYADIELRRHDGLYEFIPDVGSGAGLQSGEMTVNTQIAGKKKSSSSLTGESGRVLSGSSACSSLLGSDCTLSLAGLDTSTIIFRFAKFAWNQSKSRRPGLMSLMKATKI